MKYNVQDVFQNNPVYVYVCNWVDHYTNFSSFVDDLNFSIIKSLKNSGKYSTRNIKRT